MMLIKILVIYLIIINIYYYNEKKFTSLHFNHWGDFTRSCIILICFFCFFFVFIRLLNLFRENKTIDLNLLFQSLDIFTLVLVILMLYLIRRNIMFVVKLHFIKLHYFGIIDVLPMNKYYEQYTWVYYRIIKRFSRYFYYYFYWVDKIVTLIMLILLGDDILLNNMVLNSSLWFAPMYSMFKFIFLITKFVETKQDGVMDYYLYNLYYVGSGYVAIDRGLFALTWQSRFAEVSKYEKEVIKV